MSIEMDKKALKEFAVALDYEIDLAIEDGISDAVKFKDYLKEEKELAKAEKISGPIEVNTHGAWRYWFSETELGGCNRVQKAFVRFTNCISGLDQNPEYQEALRKVGEVTKTHNQ
jgi:hypothetical protein